MSEFWWLGDSEEKIAMLRCWMSGAIFAGNVQETGTSYKMGP